MILRKKNALSMAMVLLTIAAMASNDGRGTATPRTENLAPYDGVGIRVIKRPDTPSRPSSATTVFQAINRMHDLEANPFFKVNDYERAIAASDKTFVPARETRIKNVIKERLCKELRRRLTKIVEEEFDSGIAMSVEEMKHKRELINKIGRKRDELWLFQDDRTNPNAKSRYDPDWDDINLVEAGPIVITDTGKVDIETNWNKLKKLWDDGLDNVILVPEPPSEDPERELLVGKRIKYRTKGKIRISSTRLLKPFYQDDPQDWLDHIYEYPGYFRYFKASAGLDFFTDITQRRYCRMELAARVYADLKWTTYLNIVLYGN